MAFAWQEPLSAKGVGRSAGAGDGTVEFAFDTGECAKWRSIDR